MKKCPFCAEEIQDEAVLCRFCNRELGPSKSRKTATRQRPMRTKRKRRTAHKLSPEEEIAKQQEKDRLTMEAISSPKPSLLTAKQKKALSIGGLLLFLFLAPIAVILGIMGPSNIRPLPKDFSEVLGAGEAARAKLREPEAKASPVQAESLSVAPQNQLFYEDDEYISAMGRIWDGMKLYRKSDKEPFGIILDSTWSQVEVAPWKAMSIDGAWLTGVLVWYDRDYITANYVVKKSQRMPQ